MRVILISYALSVYAIACGQDNGYIMGHILKTFNLFLNYTTVLYSRISIAHLGIIWK